MSLVRSYFVDYSARHTNNWNRVLHVFGVPLAPFLFLFLVITGRWRWALGSFVAGDALQWAGHSLEGNEVGEWTLAKRIAGRVAAAVRK